MRQKQLEEGRVFLARSVKAQSTMAGRHGSRTYIRSQEAETEEVKESSLSRYSVSRLWNEAARIQRHLPPQLSLPGDSKARQVGYGDEASCQSCWVAFLSEQKMCLIKLTCQ